MTSKVIGRIQYLNVRKGLSTELASVGLKGCRPSLFFPRSQPHCSRCVREGLDNSRCAFFFSLYPETLMRRVWPSGRFSGWKLKRPILLGPLVFKASPFRAWLTFRTPQPPAAAPEAGLLLSSGSETAVRDRAVLTILLASQMSNRAIGWALIPLHADQPSHGKDRPREHSWVCSTHGPSGCLWPQEQNSAPPHPQPP